MSGTQEKCPAAHIRNLRDGRDTPLRGVPLVPLRSDEVEICKIEKENPMTEYEIEILGDEASEVVQDHCSRLMQTLGAFGHSGDEQVAFVQLASSQLLGGSLDLWLELHGGDTDTLGRFVCARIDAKKARDEDAKTQDLH